jgi:hypothetical protein
MRNSTYSRFEWPILLLLLAAIANFVWALSVYRPASPDCAPRIDYEPRGFVPVTEGRAVRERGTR